MYPPTYRIHFHIDNLLSPDSGERRDHEVERIVPRHALRKMNQARTNVDTAGWMI